MDEEMLVKVCARVRRILTVEENVIIGGFGSGVCEVLARKGIVLPVKNLGLPDTFLTHGSQAFLRKKTGRDKDGIRKAVKDWLRNE